jgi:hypothetical protein
MGAAASVRASGGVSIGVASATVIVSGKIVDANAVVSVYVTGVKSGSVSQLLDSARLCSSGAFTLQPVRFTAQLQCSVKVCVWWCYRRTWQLGGTMNLGSLGSPVSKTLWDRCVGL